MTIIETMFTIIFLTPLATLYFLSHGDAPRRSVQKALKRNRDWIVT